MVGSQGPGAACHIHCPFGVSQVPSVRGACFGKQLNFCVCAILRISVNALDKGLCLLSFSASAITDFTREAGKRVQGAAKQPWRSRCTVLCCWTRGLEPFSGSRIYFHITSVWLWARRAAPSSACVQANRGRHSPWEGSLFPSSCFILENLVSPPALPS